MNDDDDDVYFCLFCRLSLLLLFANILSVCNNTNTYLCLYIIRVVLLLNLIIILINLPSRYL